MEVIERIKYLEDRGKFIEHCLKFTLYQHEDFWVHKKGVQAFRTELDRKTKRVGGIKFSVIKTEIERKDYILYSVCRIA